MSYLEKNEQIHIENVEQLKAVYEVLKNEWNEQYPLDEEIKYLNNHVGYFFVNWGNKGITLFKQNDNATTITYEQFMSRVNPTTETTIIESVDGKKYKVIVVEEVLEPMTYHEWCKQQNIGSIFFSTIGELNKIVENVEKYVQYRKTFES
jgi:hypothetical protein